MSVCLSLSLSLVHLSITPFSLPPFSSLFLNLSLSVPFVVAYSKVVPEIGRQLALADNMINTSVHLPVHLCQSIRSHCPNPSIDFVCSPSPYSVARQHLSHNFLIVLSYNRSVARSESPMNRLLFVLVVKTKAKVRLSIFIYIQSVITKTDNHFINWLTDKSVNR